MSSTIALYACASLFGALVFFSSVMLPLVFARWPAPQAVPFIRSVMPAYYLFVILTAGVAAALLPPKPVSIGLAIIVVVGVWMRQWVLPRLPHADGEQAAAWIDQAKGLSVGVNLLLTVIACFVLAGFYV